MAPKGVKVIQMLCDRLSVSQRASRELQESFKIASKITPFGAKSLVVLVLN